MIYLLGLNDWTFVSSDKNKIKARCPYGHLITCTFHTLHEKYQYICPHCIKVGNCKPPSKSIRLMNEAPRSYVHLKHLFKNCRKLITLGYRSKFPDKASDFWGIYSIVNHQLKIIYVGETLNTFEERWLGHLEKVLYSNFKEPSDYQALLLHPDTSFHILYENTISRKQNLHLEASFIRLYKTYTDYKILGGSWWDNIKNKGDR